MQFIVGCDLGYRSNGPCTLILNIQAARLPRQRILRETLELSPEGPLQPHVMADSANRFIRLETGPGDIAIRYGAEVELDVFSADPGSVAEIPIAELPFDLLRHVYPSRYCPSDLLSRWPAREFADFATGHARVTAICNWIYEHIEYLRGSSDTLTTARDTLVERAGVCRDFAHLGIAFCRALNIPARFVSAYAWGLEPPDFHAVFEAYLGGRWYLFDPTRQAALDGLVRIGVGRDAAEVSFATVFGDVAPTTMAVHIRPRGEDIAADMRTTRAISISSA
jgi:transglutaminase-like putative cysteine protease